jgi:glycopeptide antibiotics resistance protein
LLFLPIGFALTALCYPGNWGRITIFFGNLMSGLGLSLIVEVLQVFVSARDPSLADILANGFGVYLGLLCFSLWGEKVLSYILVLATKDKIYFLLKIFIIVLIGYITLITFIFNFMQPAADLSNWDHTFPLILGNERTGDRPWRGHLSEISFNDRAISEAEVADIFAKNDVLENSFLISYQLTGETSYKSQTINELDLFWQGVPPEVRNEKSISLGPDHWLEIAELGVLLNQKLAEASEFTLSTTIMTADIQQDGPARLLSISKDPFQRNFTLGQEKNDLILRLRTPLTGSNGSFPELAVADVFADTAPHHLIITYKPAVVRFYLDQIEDSYHFELGPQVMFFRYFLPVDEWRIRLNTPYAAGYAVAYYSLVLVPPGFLLIYIAMMGHGDK